MTNPDHGYLTEPRWMTARNNHIEAARAVSKDRPDEMTSGELVRGTVSLPDPDFHLFAIGAVLVVIMIIAG